MLTKWVACVLPAVENEWIAIADHGSSQKVAVFTSDTSSDLLVRGYREEGFPAPDGEQAVRIPVDVLLAAAAKLDQ